MPTDQKSPISRLSNAVLIVTTASYAFSILLHLYLITFSRYLTDDYCSAWRAQVMGILRATYAWYRIWSGRYSANFLDALAGALGVEFYSASIILIVLAWISTSSFLVHQLILRITGQKNTLISLFLTLGITATLLNSIPLVEQSIYWGQGIRTLLPPLILMPLLAAALLRLNLHTLTRFKFAGLYLATFIFAFFSGGFSETGFIAQAGSSALAVGYLVYRKQFSYAKFIGVFLLGNLAAFLVMWLSPGRAIRQENFTTAAGLPELLSITFQSYFAWLTANVHPFWSATACTFFAGGVAAAFLRLKPEVEAKIKPGLLYTFGSAVVISILCFVPGAYAISESIPPRTMILPQAFGMMGMACLGFFAGTFASKRLSQTKWLAAVMVILCSAIILFNADATQRTLANLSKYQDYARAWEKQDQTIREAARQGKTQLVLPSLDNPAQLDNLTSNPDHWLNKCYSQYYKIEVTVP